MKKSLEQKREELKELYPLLKHSDEWVRSGAVLAIGFTLFGTGLEEEVKNLLTLVKDPSGVVRANLAFTIGLIFMGTHSETGMNVLKILNMDLEWRVRLHAKIAPGFVFLGTGSKEGLKIIRSQKEDSNEWVRHGTAVGLGLIFMGTQSKFGKENLQSMLSSSEGFCSGAAIGLGLIFIGSGAEEVVKILLPLLEDSSEWVRRSAAYGIGLIYLRTGKGANFLYPLFSDLDWMVYFAAAWSVAFVFLGVKSKGKLKDLIEAHSAKVRRGGATALGMAFLETFCTSEAVTLLRPLLGDASKWVRRGATISAGLICLGSDNEKMIKKMQSLFDDRDGWVRFFAAWSIGMIGLGTKSKTGIEVLSSVLNTYDEWLRRSAAFAIQLILLGTSMEDEEVDKILKPLQRDSDSGVRFCSALKLGTFHENKKVEGLITTGIIFSWFIFWDLWILSAVGLWLLKNKKLFS